MVSINTKKYLFIKEKKVEFELPTIKFLNQTIPFSGGYIVYFHYIF